MNEQAGRPNIKAAFLLLGVGALLFAVLLVLSESKQDQISAALVAEGWDVSDVEIVDIGGEDPSLRVAIGGTVDSPLELCGHLGERGLLVEYRTTVVDETGAIPCDRLLLFGRR